MPIALNSDKALGQLEQVAQMAYGSGRTEKTDGGAGYIGLINGHVVKFATRSGERPFGGIKVTDDVKRSCDELRQTLGRLAKDALSKSVVSDSSAAESLRRIYASLGLDSEGKVMDGLIGKKSLLSRKIVAKALNAIQEEVNRDGHHNVNVWEKAQRVTAADRHAMTEADTNFDTVAEIAKAEERTAKVVATLKNLKTPLDVRLENILTGTTTVDGNFSRTTEFSGYMAKMASNYNQEDCTAVWRSLKALQTGLQNARNTFVDRIAKDLATVAVKEMKFKDIATHRRASADKTTAKGNISRAQEEFLNAVSTAFAELSGCGKFSERVQGSLCVWGDEDFHTAEFITLTKKLEMGLPLWAELKPESGLKPEPESGLKSENIIGWTLDPTLDYLSFFEGAFRLGVMHKLG